MSAGNHPRYTIGRDTVAPFAVYLTINTADVDVDQFRADPPRLAATLERLIVGARDDAARGEGTVGERGTA